MGGGGGVFLPELAMVARAVSASGRAVRVVVPTVVGRLVGFVDTNVIGPLMAVGVGGVWLGGRAGGRGMVVPSGAYLTSSWPPVGVSFGSLSA